MKGRRVPSTVVLTVAVLGTVLLSCIDDERASGGLGSGSGTGANSGCVEGASRECGIELAEHEGVIWCAKGAATCLNGVWSECVTDSVVTKQATGFELHALSTPTSCNNACDPNCMLYAETPMTAITSTAQNPRYDWSSGGTAASTNANCNDAADCQHDTKCVNPNSSCEHDVCTTGGPLASGCDSCATAVCAANAACCQQPTSDCSAYGTAACASGSTSTVCQVQNTVVGTNCDTRCAVVSGSTCIDAFTERADTICTPDAVAAAVNCTTNRPAGTNDIICRCSRPGGGTWDTTCTDLVDQECGAFCGEASDTAGHCVDWAPGETNPACAGYDLTVGVGCAGTIVICNRGTVAAPTDINIVHYPYTAGVDPFAVCNPTVPGTASYCATPGPIPPGECIDVAGCSNLTTGPRAVMVNPPGAGQVTECMATSCMNNWAVWNPVACTGPTCQVTYTAPTSCQFAVPFTHDVNDTPSATYSTGDPNDAPQTMTQVGSAADCTTGLQWYWTDTTETSITLCPATCSNLTSGADQCNAAGVEYYDATSGRCYMFNATSVDWDAARTGCQANTWKGDLAAITSAAEQTFVQGLVATEALGSAWLGGKDDVTEGVWYWAPGDPWITSYLAPGQPGGGDNPRDCLIILQNGYWDDDGCGGSQHYVCERGRLPKKIAFSKPCPAFYGAENHTEIYEPNCGAGKAVQWGFLGWDAETPSDSSVEFRFRSAIDVASLSSATWQFAAVASATLGNEVCSISAPTANCPADLFEILDGLPTARYPVGELEIRTLPSTSGTNTAVVNSWTVTYSCVDSE